MAADETSRPSRDEKLEKLTAVMEGIDYGVVFLDTDLRAHIINNAFREMWGYPEELVANKPTMAELMYFNRYNGIYNVAEEDFDAYVDQRVAAVVAGPIPPTEFERRDGKILRYQCIALPDGGRMLTYLDITEETQRKRNLEDAYGVIRSSIQYASRIQRSLLPNEDSFLTLFGDHFILWEPRDLVGGDIYWSRTWGDGVLFILADCTGHGVPGAFMTLIATGALDRAQEEVRPGDVAGLIQRMHQLTQLILGQHEGDGESDDGLELGAVYMLPGKDSLTFAGARFELFVVKDGTVAEFKGARKGIGYRGIPFTQVYEETDIPVRRGAAFYLTTDGLTDQVGGEKRRMFGKKRFKELLLQVSCLPMQTQKERISQALAQYQGDETRRDDVSVVGFALELGAGPNRKYADFP